MKKRNGFVSNSSSSSFVVKVWGELEKAYQLLSGKEGEKQDRPPHCATSQEIRFLLKKGFVPSSIIRDSMMAYQVHNRLEPCFRDLFDRKYPFKKTPFWLQKEVDEETCALVFSVDCNEADIIRMLVKKNIPFTAACHYGNETVFFKRDGKHVVTIANAGEETEMYGDSCALKHKELVRKQSVKDILEDK